jgi:thioredoxin 1
MAGNLREFSDATFQDEVLGSDQPVLVDFWAPWCGPCKMLTPTIESLAEKYTGNRQSAINYQINSIPTLIVFKGGKAVDRMLGLQPADRIAQLLDKHVG